MGKQKLKIKLVAQYNGHSIKNNGDLDLNFKTDYSEIVNVVSLVRMLNQNVIIKAKIGQKEPEDLGTFNIKNINIDREGEAKVKFNSDANAVNSTTISDLLQPDTLIILQCSAIVETEDEEDD